MAAGKDRLGEAGCHLTVGQVDFQPGSLELPQHDLSLAKAGLSPTVSPANPPGLPQGSSQLSIKRLYIDAELQSLLRLAPVVDAIQVEDPVLSLTHLGAGRYDIDDIVERLRPAPDEPASQPLRLQGGVFHADIKVGFEQTPETVVRIAGTVTAEQVRLLGASGAPATAPELLGFERLHVVMDEVRPPEHLVRLSPVVLTSPVLNLTRDRSGRLNLQPASPSIAREALIKH